MKQSNQNTLKENSQINPDLNAFSEINFKETYMFRLNNVDYKFSFFEKNSATFLSYYKHLTSDDENSTKTLIDIEELKDFMVSTDESSKISKSIIQIRYKDQSKVPLEFISYNKSDFEKFIQKLEKHIKKV